MATRCSSLRTCFLMAFPGRIVPDRGGKDLLAHLRPTSPIFSGRNPTLVTARTNEGTSIRRLAGFPPARGYRSMTNGQGGLVRSAQEDVSCRSRCRLLCKKMDNPVAIVKLVDQNSLLRG